MPEPSTRAFAARAGRHLSRNLEGGLQIADAVGVYGEDSEVFWLDIVGVTLIGDSETTSHDLGGINRISSVVRTNCEILISFGASFELTVKM